MSSKLRFLHHPTPQPCRTVHQFMLEAEIPFEEEVVNFMDGDNEKQEFKVEYNPTGQVPGVPPLSGPPKTRSIDPNGWTTSMGTSLT